MRTVLAQVSEGTVDEKIVQTNCTSVPVQPIISPDRPKVQCVGTMLETSVTDASERVRSEPSAPVDASAEWKEVLIPVPWGGSDGAPCFKMVQKLIPVDATVPENGGLSPRISVCPPNLLGDPESGARAAEPRLPSETPSEIAVRYWNEVPLPGPQPYIAPGRAITGLLAYLETRGTTEHTYVEPNTPFGPLEIVAKGTYYVDWGDGTHTGPHAFEGGPWPDGKIKHEYIHVGAYDVVVTERWTAKWSFGSESGTLDELRTVGRIDDFPVQQIQAVVLR
jgi:hypothetical protein